jgi:cell division protein FtsW
MDVSIYRLRHRDILTVCVLALLCLGAVMVQSASMNVTGQLGWRWSGSSLKDIFFAIFAIAAFFIIGHIDYSKLVRSNAKIWRQPIVWMMATTMFACLIVLVPHIGMEVNGARRWLPLGICQVQPSELAKWAVVLFLAWWLTEQPVDLDYFGKGFLVTLVPIGAICLLIVIQDFGTAALIALCALTMLVVGKVKWWHLGIVIPPAIGAGMWFVMHKEYRWRRMTAFVDPWAAPQGEGYHMIQSLLSFSTGGVTGRGLGNGIQKLGYLPEDTTDFIFAVICEELGLFGALLTVALYLGILYVAWQAVKEKRDSFGRLLAFGIASMIGLQAMINIAVATVSVPTKGLSLPLVSAGGSGLVITCAALGLLYSITRFSKPQEAAKDFTHEPTMEPISTSSLMVHSIWRGLAAQESDETTT